MRSSLVSVQSMWRRASAGRRRAARRPPTAPANRPPRRRGRWRASSSRGVHGGVELHELRAGLDGALAEPAGPPPTAAGAGDPGAAAEAAWATVALSSGPIGAHERGSATPISAPRTPPRAPWASDSPVTWRTTRRCGQPIALSVPSSRVRLVTDDSVSRLAIRNAASSATIVSAPPSLPARSLASAASRSRGRRGPGSWWSRRRGSRLDPRGHAGHGVRAVGPDVQGVHPALAVRHRLELGELHVHVRGLSAERRRGEADDRERFAERDPVADPDVLARRVARVEDRLARVAGGELARPS